jgi:hypothetical protein
MEMYSMSFSWFCYECLAHLTTIHIYHGGEFYLLRKPIPEEIHGPATSHWQL